MEDKVKRAGTVDHTCANPREVIERSLELSATALILVQNHASDDPTPSSADFRMTNRNRRCRQTAFHCPPRPRCRGVRRTASCCAG
ncbi:JAB domain-containing protein [Devosia salina]|uniref:MPN domain-containing protein n=1 Tax=Devosia salina TaxID=2860336 RepID=A0ABX8WAK7_9HYPH|nr:hypothetical protein K1X15_10775 [Devosia salina]